MSFARNFLYEEIQGNWAEDVNLLIEAGGVSLQYHPHLSLVRKWHCLTSMRGMSNGYQQA